MSKIINILTSKLNYELANLIYIEYEERMREINYFFSNYEYYSYLKERINLVESLLAISIFYKKVITNIDGFLGFERTLKSNNVSKLTIGSKTYDSEEIKKLYSIILHFRSILENYNFPPSLFDYHETKDFLKNILDYSKING